MSSPDLCFIVGARPNFVKAAPVVKEAHRRGISSMLVHTGQHTSDSMSGSFLRDLEMPPPDVFLTVERTTHAGQTAEIMVGVEDLLMRERPSRIVVFGDVNSTIAASLAASKLTIPVAHVEAGLRSGDRTMPEEINRIVTDHIADLLFTTEPAGNDNLAAEGIPSDRIHYVGNSMIDSLVEVLPRANAIAAETMASVGVGGGTYAVLTLHRPSNVDDVGILARIIDAVVRALDGLPVVFPVHPRTARRLGELPRAVHAVEPMGYVEFISLVVGARLVLTDSGGLQEESTYLDVPCVTLRDNTERPITVSHGTNTLGGTEPEAMVGAITRLISTRRSSLGPPHLWDGRAGQRIVDVLEVVRE